MQASKRYALLVLCILLILLSRHIYITLTRSSGTSTAIHLQEPRYDIQPARRSFVRYVKNRSKVLLVDRFQRCTFSDCFNFSRCSESLTVHIYPAENNEEQMRKYFRSDKWRISDAYEKILQAVRTSKYYNQKLEHACILVLSFDTLDRDPLSANYVKELGVAMKNLEASVWNKGLNHLIFNLYFGTWPLYKSNDFGVDFDRAIIAKASFSDADLRSSFDLSLPLFPQSWPSSCDESLKKQNYISNAIKPPIRCSRLTDENRPYACLRYGKPYLLTFKGKRYTHGVGSAGRNALYHLHNGKDVIMLTTCRHGRNWERTKDERCDRDSVEYDRWDYSELLTNSTFCLIPRGRRLGSYRFLEALAAGCIPVILADGWVPPFSEVLDWRRAIVMANESAVFQIPEFLRSLSEQQVDELRSFARSFYRLYLSDVEKIVDTTLEVIRGRIFTDKASSAVQWNSAYGGAWAHLPEQYSATNGAFKYPWDKTWPDSVLPNLTAVVNIFRPFHGYLSKVKKLLRELLGSSDVQKIYVLVHFSSVNQILPKHSVERVQVMTKSDKRQGIFYGFDLRIDSDAVIFVDLSSPLKMSEVHLALMSYKLSPHRLISYKAYDEVFDELSQSFVLADESETKCFSAAADSGLIMDRFYFDWLKYQTTERSAGRSPKSTVDFSACFDLIQNAVVGRLTDDQPPMKLILEKDKSHENNTTEEQIAKNVISIDLNQKRLCFDKFLSLHKHLRLASSFLHRRVCSTADTHF